MSVRIARIARYAVRFSLCSAVARDTARRNIHSGESFYFCRSARYGATRRKTYCVARDTRDTDICLRPRGTSLDHRPLTLGRAGGHAPARCLATPVAGVGLTPAFFTQYPEFSIGNGTFCLSGENPLVRPYSTGLLFRRSVALSPLNVGPKKRFLGMVVWPLWRNGVTVVWPRRRVSKRLRKSKTFHH